MQHTTLQLPNLPSPWLVANAVEVAAGWRGWGSPEAAVYVSTVDAAVTVVVKTIHAGCLNCCVVPAEGDLQAWARSALHEKQARLSCHPRA